MEVPFPRRLELVASAKPTNESHFSLRALPVSCSRSSRALFAQGNNKSKSHSATRLAFVWVRCSLQSVAFGLSLRRHEKQTLP